MAVSVTSAVTVELGRDPRLVRVARLAARSMATDAGFGLDELEDLALAIDELSAVAMAAMQDTARMRIHLETDDLGISARAIIVGESVPLEVEDMARSILDHAVDRWAINDQSVAFRLVKVLPGLV